MENKPGHSREFVTANVELGGPDWRLRAQVSVPKGPMQLSELLPLVQSFADAVIHSTVKVVEEQGQKISCKKGCSACCRQLAPIAETEARHIRNIVEALAEPRRTVIRTRFAEACQRLEKAGLLEQLRHADQLTEGDRRALGLKYFAQGIPCPFLEDGACSIYADRPIACREYLVTSPAENCTQPTPETIQRVKTPLQVWTALARLDAPSPLAPVSWAPLILAPTWAAAHSDEPLPRSGPELLQELFGHLSKAGRPPTQPEAIEESA
ncbi:MAG TPA: YkgJ family cysteine cluster protein [Methylomirabilota bacterium]|jgi:Fe-S-cluster containining protein|nr:YkgJ family cysteine cluster protein [Methylomirabilota bacterium]